MIFYNSKTTRSLTVFMSAAIFAACTSGSYSNTVCIEGDSKDVIIEKAANVVPTMNQLSALENEFIAFVHFGPNTFTQKEWGSGFESSDVFELKELDTDQWCRAIKAAGMKMVILTAKHHDGFVMWQSRYTDHGIMSSGFRDGKGDVMKDLSESCRKYGLKLGVYLSPADLYQIESPDGLYGNLSKPSVRTIPREVPGRPFADKRKFEFVLDDYNEYYLNQMFELLTEYGPIHEVWLDGAHPKRKGGQTYDYASWKELIHTLAPEAVVFGREDTRWCGNEAGRTRTTEWNVIPYMENPDTLRQFHDMTGNDLGSREKLYAGKWLHYQPAEVDVSIRDGWFYRGEDNQMTRSADDIFDMYERSVGGNSIFLLNIPPDRKGRLSDRDVAVLEETGRRIRETYSTNMLEGASGPSKVLDGKGSTYITLDEGEDFIIRMPEKRLINRIVLQEAIASVGERVESFAVDAMTDGEWTEIASATNIGYKRIVRFPDVETDRLRFRLVSSRLSPAISNISAHYSRYLPFQGLAFRAPAMLEYDKSAWMTENGTYSIDFGKPMNIGGFAYIPSADGDKATIKGTVSISIDGKTWTEILPFDLGNLVNDQTTRYCYFHNPVGCRFMRIIMPAQTTLSPTSEIDLF